MRDYIIMLLGSFCTVLGGFIMYILQYKIEHHLSFKIDETKKSGLQIGNEDYKLLFTIIVTNSGRVPSGIRKFEIAHNKTGFTYLEMHISSIPITNNIFINDPVDCSCEYEYFCNKVKALVEQHHISIKKRVKIVALENFGRKYTIMTKHKAKYYINKMNQASQPGSRRKI